MDKKKRLENIFVDIKSIKFQGATNVAKAAIEAYSISPSKKTADKLISLRPTEPMLQRVVALLEKGKTKEEIISHFSSSQDKINKEVFSIIKNGDVIFTHCHSTNVVKALIYAKKRGKKFQVFNTETRPLFQGRKTAIELSNAGIKVTNFVDSAAALAINLSSKVFLGSDAILKNGDVINKVGSGMFSQIARDSKKPVYILADSWKFTKKNLDLEQRKSGEVWDNKIPSHIKIKNPAFEKIPSKNISFIISELGILHPKKFVAKA